MIDETYTYTARSVEDSTDVVTFTLRGSNVLVELGVPLEQIESTLGGTSGEKRAQPAHMVGKWAKPIAVSMVERMTHPVNVRDLQAHLDGGYLEVTAWLRPRGLRLARFTLFSDHVDNPDAAEAFISELDRRKDVAARPGKFRGLFDYWAGWAATTVTGLFLLWRGFRRLWPKRSR